MWRKHAKSRAIASDLIQQDLSREGYSFGLVSERGFTFRHDEVEKHGVRGTKFDFMYPQFDFIIYLDGQPHLKDRQATRDEAITQVLRERGYMVERYSYSAPISHERRKEIIDAIKKVLDKKGYHAWARRIFRG